MKHALVTGGSGFIGAYLVRALLDKGDKVSVLDNLTRGRPERLDGVRDDICVHDADIRDEEAVANAARGADVIYHLAAINGTENFYTQAELVLDVGIRGMLSVVNACKRNNIGELVVASSAEVYQTPTSIPTNESAVLMVPDPLNPRYSYGGSKIVSELIAFNYARADMAQVQVFRPHNVYGPDMGWKHVIPQFIERLLPHVTGDPTTVIPFQIQGDGTETRAFCYVEDVVRGILLMQEKGGDRQIYHIGAMDEVEIRQVAALVGESLQLKIEIIAGDPAPGSTRRRCPDIGKMTALGYSPTVSLSEGIARTAAWYADNAKSPGSNPLL
jgi:UDP-glucose 4-epimerase